jgi:prophage antirepressor-like protein
MTELQLFRPPFPANGYELRVDIREGDPWFVATDPCGMLDIADVRRAVSRLDEADRRQAPLRSSGQARMVWWINESGLYELIMRSDKSEARIFRRWVTSEVLPSIRKTGSYGIERKLSRRELALLVIEAEDRIAELEPKSEAFDAFMDTSDSESLATVAKMLGTGQNRLFAFLREHGVLISTAGVRFNTPKQVYVERGWFDIVAGTRKNSSDEDVATYTTRVLPKGVEGIRRLLNRRLLNR